MYVCCVHAMKKWERKKITWPTFAIRLATLCPPTFARTAASRKYVFLCVWFGESARFWWNWRHFFKASSSCLQIKFLWLLGFRDSWINVFVLYAWMLKTKMFEWIQVCSKYSMNHKPLLLKWRSWKICVQLEPARFLQDALWGSALGPSQVDHWYRYANLMLEMVSCSYYKFLPP